MVTLKVQNFKSIDDLELDLGRVNLLIGENGCGKSSILEAIGMAAAAAAGDLSTGALKARGIRVTDASWMRSAFEERTRVMPVRLGLHTTKAAYHVILTHDNTPYGVWRDRTVNDVISGLEVPDDTIELMNRQFHAIAAELPASAIDKPESVKQLLAAVYLLGVASALGLPQYLAYAPREDVLRDLARDSDVEPIGVHGEGLFKLLEVLDSEGKLPAVKEQLALLGWFDDISITSGVNPSSGIRGRPRGHPAPPGGPCQRLRVWLNAAPSRARRSPPALRSRPSPGRSPRWHIRLADIDPHEQTAELTRDPLGLQPDRRDRLAGAAFDDHHPGLRRRSCVCHSL